MTQEILKNNLTNIICPKPNNRDNFKIYGNMLGHIILLIINLLKIWLGFIRKGIPGRWNSLKYLENGMMKNLKSGFHLILLLINFVKGKRL